MSSTQTEIVLVAGATGSLGSEICRQLARKNTRVKALVRSGSDPGKIAMLRTLGVETLVGDLKDIGSLEKAMQGITVVISTVSCTFSRQEGDSIKTVDEEGQANLISAAAAAGIGHFIFISFCGMSGDSPLQTAKRTTERSLIASGLVYTILQPTFFMESWLSPALGFDYPNAKVTIYGEGMNSITWIGLADVAACAVASINNPLAKNKSIELGGPAALTPLEVVAIFETAKGKKFEITIVPATGLQAQKEAAQDPLSESFAALMLAFAAGSVIDTKHMTNIFPMRLTSVSQYAQA